MAGEVLVDALPYYDQGYDESGVREAVGFALSSILFYVFCFEPTSYNNFDLLFLFEHLQRC